MLVVANALQIFQLMQIAVFIDCQFIPKIVQSFFIHAKPSSKQSKTMAHLQFHIFVGLSYFPIKSHDLNQKDIVRICRGNPCELDLNSEIKKMHSFIALNTLVAHFAEIKIPRSY